ncbi:hypothetical protein H920_04063 [Fukomys damarensis]|uniref:Uncharacterized protein n=1 Tax=Fukomys damarensis TaxID=885580 RepID=A0A091EGJ2_FUKDA|nr:hypothetical protein H920_04063 [Fukomys damarensis]
MDPGVHRACRSASPVRGDERAMLIGRRPSGAPPPKRLFRSVVSVPFVRRCAWACLALAPPHRTVDPGSEHSCSSLSLGSAESPGAESRALPGSLAPCRAESSFCSGPSIWNGNADPPGAWRTEAVTAARGAGANRLEALYGFLTGEKGRRLPKTSRESIAESLPSFKWASALMAGVKLPPREAESISCQGGVLWMELARVLTENKFPPRAGPTRPGRPEWIPAVQPPLAQESPLCSTGRGKRYQDSTWLPFLALALALELIGGPEVDRTGSRIGVRFVKGSEITSIAAGGGDAYRDEEDSAVPVLGPRTGLSRPCPAPAMTQCRRHRPQRVPATVLTSASADSNLNLVDRACAHPRSDSQTAINKSEFCWLWEDCREETPQLEDVQRSQEARQRQS